MAIEIKGLDSLMAKLNAMGGDVLDALDKAVRETTLVAQGDARANAPVDTGALKVSISTEFDRNAESSTGTAYTNIEYGLYQEMGTVNMAAHPYMMPALNANKSTFEQLARKELETAIRKAAK
jgi:HK97 gp10 family phage protein